MNERSVALCSNRPKSSDKKTVCRTLKKPDKAVQQIGSVPWIFGITPQVQNHIEGDPYHVLNMTGYFRGSATTFDRSGEVSWSNWVILDP